MPTDVKPNTIVHVLLMGARKDRKLLKQFELHLHPLERSGWIKSWNSYDGTLGGDDWRLVIEHHLQRADVIVLLMTIQFVGPDEYYTHEILPALMRHQAGKARVVPVLLRSCSLDTLPLAGLPVLPVDKHGGVKALDLWSNRSLAWLYVYEGVEKIVMYKKEQAHASPTPASETVTLSNIPPRNYHANFSADGEVEHLRQTFLRLKKSAHRVDKEPIAPAVHVITGTGDTDKKEQALAYVYHYRPQYQAVFWLRGESREQLIVEFIDLATIINIPQKDDADPQIVIDEVKQWLRAQNSWLLIFEAIKDVALLEEFLPSNSQGDVLVITREKIRQVDAVATVENSRKDAFQAMRQQDHDAADLLQLCIYLYGQFIPVDLLRLRPSVLSSGLKQCVRDDDRLKQLLNTLVTWQFIQYDEQNGALYIAHAIQDAVRAIIGERSRKAWLKRALLLCERAFLEPDPEAWSQCQRYLPHVLRCTALAQTEQIDEPIVAKLLERVGRYLYARGIFQDALKFYTQALEQVEHSANGDQALKAQLWYDLGMLLRSLGKEENYQPAKEYYTQALKLREQLFGMESAEVAQTLSGLGELYQTQEALQDAENCYIRALEIRKKATHPVDADIATSLADLAGIYDEQGNYIQAEEYYRQARALRERVSRAPIYQSTDTAQLYGNMARFYRVVGRYEQAAELYQYALEIYQRVLGPEHRKVALILNNYAFLYRCMHRYAEAQRMAASAIRIWTTTFGLRHRDTVAGCNTLAKIYSDQGDYARADGLFQRVLAFRESMTGPGPDSTSTAQVLDYLGENEFKQNHLREAEEDLLRALTIRERKLGEDHADTAASLYHVARLHRVLRNSAVADTFYRRALAIYNRIFGPFSIGHPEVIACQQEYTSFLREQEH